MKLSAEAKKVVASRVAAAFSDKLKALQSKRDAAAEHCKEEARRIQEPINKLVSDTIRPKLAKILSQFGEVSSKIDLNDFHCELSFNWVDSLCRYGRCYVNENHNSLIDLYSLHDPVDRIDEEIGKLEDEIKSRVSYALFEIEIRGKKNTLEEIIKDAISKELKAIKED